MIPATLASTSVLFVLEDSPNSISAQGTGNTHSFTGKVTQIGTGVSNVAVNDICAFIVDEIITVTYNGIVYYKADISEFVYKEDPFAP